MGAAQKKRPIGFVTSEKEKKEEGKGPKDALKRKGPSDPEGPILGVLRIRLAPVAYRSLAKSNFVKMRLKSDDGMFAVDMILRDSGLRLQLVPVRMPEISIRMEPKELSNMEMKTIVMLEDGAGNNRGYAIASIRQAELMNSGWVKKKHMVS